MVRIRHKGDYKITKRFLARDHFKEVATILHKYGKEGVKALAAHTPVDTGATASAWAYEVEENSSGAVIYWTNSNINNGVPIAVMIQYGHGTRNGGYVAGRDYINPALRPIFDKILLEAWGAVTKNG